MKNVVTIKDMTNGLNEKLANVGDKFKVDNIRANKRYGKLYDLKGIKHNLTIHESVFSEYFKEV